MRKADILAAIKVDNRFRAEWGDRRFYETYTGPLHPVDPGRWRMTLSDGRTITFTSAQIIEPVAKAEAREAQQTKLYAEREAERVQEAERRSRVLAAARRDSEDDQQYVDSLLKSAEADYRNARKRLRTVLKDDEPHTKVIQSAHTVAWTSGHLQGVKEIVTAFNFGGWINVARLFIKEFDRGADDTWSGRENDSKRVHHDGYRAAFDTIDHLVEDALWNLMSAHYAPEEESE